jgi:small nuclear ribonucleoprotein G
MPLGGNSKAPNLFFFQQYMEKRLFIQLNGNRKVIGILRGYDVGFFPQLILSATFDVSDGS